jgi:hypothetical protein
VAHPVGLVVLHFDALVFLRMEPDLRQSGAVL